MAIDVTRFLEGLRRAERIAFPEIRQGVVEFTAEVQGEASRLAPVDEGTLRASGSYFVDGKFKGDTTNRGRDGTPNRQSTTETQPVPGYIRAVVGFNTPYAAVQHEERFNHPRGGEDKYLEKAMRRKRHLLPVAIRRRLARKGF